MSNRIRVLRKQRTLTQVQLGELAGVPASTVARAEIPTVFPRVPTARKIAAALGVTIDALLV